MTDPGCRNGWTRKQPWQGPRGSWGVIPKEKADIINRYAKAELIDIPSIGEGIKAPSPWCRSSMRSKFLPGDAGSLFPPDGESREDDFLFVQVRYGTRHFRAGCQVFLLSCGPVNLCLAFVLQVFFRAGLFRSVYKGQHG